MVTSLSFQKEERIDIRDEIRAEVQLILDLPAEHFRRSRVGIRNAIAKFGEIEKTAWTYNKSARSSVLWVYLKDGTSFNIQLGFRLRSGG